MIHSSVHSQETKKVRGKKKDKKRGLNVSVFTAHVLSCAKDTMESVIGRAVGVNPGWVVIENSQLHRDPAA